MLAVDGHTSIMQLESEVKIIPHQGNHETHREIHSCASRPTANPGSQAMNQRFRDIDQCRYLQRPNGDRLGKQFGVSKKRDRSIWVGEG
jgi:hypothetical protein